MSLLPHVSVTVDQSSPTVAQAGFGTVMLLEQVSAATLAARFTTYATTTEIAASSLPAAAKAKLAVVLSQNPRPALVMVGRRVPGTAQVITVTITTEADGTWSFTLNGVTIAFIAASNTGQEIAEGLAAQVELIADAENVTVGAVASGVFTITANIAGDAITLGSLTKPGSGVGTVATTTANAAAEDISDALDAIEAAGAEFYGYAIDSRKTAQITEAAAWAASRQKLFVCQTIDEGLATTLGNLSYRNTVHITKRAAGDYADAALLGVCLSRNLDAETITWAYKTLIGVPLDAGSGVTDPYTSSELAAILTAGSNYYAKVAGKNFLYDGKTVTGEWIDVITTEHYLTARTAEATFGAIAGNPKKVPYNAAGANIIAGALRGVCQIAAAAGHIEPTYTVTVPDPSTLTEVQRASRTLPNCIVNVRVTGAIHTVAIIINMGS